MKSVCITGATGMIGGVLVRRLLEDGTRVQALCRPSQRADELEKQGIDVVRGDLANAEAIDRAVAGTDVVFHIAAKVSGPGDLNSYLETNVKGTERVLSACVHRKVNRVVYVSSIAVYGSVRDGERIDETTPYDEQPEQRDAYSRSKIVADRLAVSFGEKIPVTVIRPGIVYGPAKPIPLGLLAFRLGNTNFVFGNRQNRIPLNYVENLVDAMILAAHAEGTHSRQYVVIDDEDLTLEKYHHEKSGEDHTRTLFLPGWPVLVGGSLGGLPRRHVRRALQDRRYDTRRIREELGWEPKIPLGEAIRQVVTEQARRR